ncbi:MAG: dTDP-4-dehydrorhamnose reductase [Prochloraceae cyanobacterium]|nr:dTDP-4-dehydrorhamnose reductase [Prochloraceae cyanobacterium]
MNKTLLIGAKGQVGRELQSTLSGDVTALGREDLDLTQKEQICQVIDSLQPNLIVNAAAYTAVDKAETEKDLAESINAIAPKILAAECAKIGATLIHISTDYVFDGTKNTPYLEADKTNPLGVYGQTKRAGEIAIQNSEAKHIILRTAWVYGTYGKSNFVKTMLRLAKERAELRVVTDQVGSPTRALDIANAIAALTLQDGCESIYHFTNSGVASWYDFAVAIFEEAEKLGFPLKIKQVVPIATSEYPTPAKRPAYSVLSSKKISKILGNHPPHWRESLREMLQKLSTEQ